MPHVKHRFVAYTTEEEQIARRLGTAAALLWPQIPGVVQTMIIEQSMMIEPSSPVFAQQRKAVQDFIDEKSAEGKT